MDLNKIVNIAFISLAVLLVALVLIIFLFKKWQERKLFRSSLKLKLLLIRVPEKTDSSENQSSGRQNPLEEINLTSQLVSILSSLKSPFVLEAAVHGAGEDINFYLAVPREARDFATRAIQGLWPEADVAEVEDYNIFNPRGIAEGAQAFLKKNYALPVKIFSEAGLDTFAPILNNFSKLHQTEEGMAMQVVIRPAPSSAVKNVSEMIRNLKKGKRLSGVLRWKIDLGFTQSEDTKNKEKMEPKPVDEIAVKALEQKIAKPLLAVNLRLVVSSGDKNKAKLLSDGLINSFNQFSAPIRNEFKFKRISRPEKFLKFIFRQFDPGRSMILSSDEIASFFHLPSSTLKVPKINWLRFKEAPPPLDLPTEGVYIGDSVFRGETKPVFIAEEDRLKHIYMIGQTGTGKSNLLNILARSDIQSGKGVAVIDPHGSLIEAVASAIPPERYKDVIYFDPGDIERPMGLNMLEYNLNRPEEKTFVVNEMFAIFNKLYDMSLAGGPMFERYTRNALLLLMEDAPNELATLMEVPRVFTDSDFRERKLARITNPTVIDFWEREALETTGDQSLANFAGYVSSKFDNFISNDYMRLIIGQTKSAFNFREIMDQGKILLVNLNRGRIGGDMNANLLGMIFLSRILMAALSRGDIPEENRRVFNVYVDEFQNFATESVPAILSEARKYRLSLTLAHQFIAQLKDQIRDAVFGNVGSVICFRVGLTDAEFLAKQFEPVFSKRDLINIDNLNAYARILISGKISVPFNIRMKYESRGDPSLSGKLKALSAAAFGRDRAEVETEILKRLRE